MVSAILGPKKEGDKMSFGFGIGWLILMIRLAVFALGICLVVLLIRALLKYIHSDNVRKEDEAVTRTLGETLLAHRTRCQMTQEFVAGSLGVSRQAVSKWEKGLSSPSTANLLALAKLYGVSVEELLRNVT